MHAFIHEVKSKLIIRFFFFNSTYPQNQLQDQDKISSGLQKHSRSLSGRHPVPARRETSARSWLSHTCRHSPCSFHAPAYRPPSEIRLCNSLWTVRGTSGFQLKQLGGHGAFTDLKTAREEQVGGLELCFGPWEGSRQPSTGLG